jgi:hypothetical protein
MMLRRRRGILLLFLWLNVIINDASEELIDLFVLIICIGLLDDSQKLFELNET